MKILQSGQINAFGGLNFIHNELEQLGIGELLATKLPSLASQSNYCWKDIFYSLLSIYYCGGEHLEDIKTILSRHFGYSPYFKLCSPDTVSRRLKGLGVEDSYCKTPRGSVVHQYNHNGLLADLNMLLLKKLGAFDSGEMVLDYDNTILYNEKKDSKMTYKKAYGYQPGVCFVNEHDILYIENRNGNSDAKSFQVDTLNRMFDHMDKNGVPPATKFRADAASYQYGVLELLGRRVSNFYIGVRNSYVEGYYPDIDNWEKTTDSTGEEISIGSIEYTPFIKHYKKGEVPTKYRLLVKRKERNAGQANLFTGDVHEYRAVVTDDFECTVKQGLAFYDRRGCPEREFDVGKNDFGWASLPFSELRYNTVFLYFTAMCRNLYNVVVERLSKKFKVKPRHRMKRLIFTLVTLPAKWVRKARSMKLRIYGNLPLRI